MGEETITATKTRKHLIKKVWIVVRLKEADGSDCFKHTKVFDVDKLVEMMGEDNFATNNKVIALDTAELYR